MIAVNSTSLFVYCLFARMVGLFVSARYIMTIFLAIMLFILALNCQSREEHCPDKCPFQISYKRTDRKYYEYYGWTGRYIEWTGEYYEQANQQYQRVNEYYEWANEYCEYYELVRRVLKINRRVFQVLSVDLQLLRKELPCKNVLFNGRT